MAQDSQRPVDLDPERSADSAGQELPRADHAAEAAPRQDQADLLQQVEALKQELELTKSKYLRAMADCQNIHKRGAAERSEAIHRAQADMAKALLPVLDNFERTMEAARGASQASPVADGVRIVYEQMLKALGEFGLERLDLATGDTFDPAYHQAVAHEPSDQVEADHVLHVAQPGYRVRDRLLRPASVVVARRPAAPREQEQ